MTWFSGDNKLNISPKRQKNLSFEILDNLENQGISPNLFDSNEKVNFIYRVKNTELRINRMKEINGLGTHFCFERIENEVLSHNLSMIDSQMPLIISEMLREYYFHSVKNIADLTDYVSETNPIKINKQFYFHKIKELLFSAALGMQPTIEWEGTDKVISKYISGKISSELLDYYTYSRDSLETYMFNNTELFNSNTVQNKKDFLYKENGEVFLSLNFQLAFT
jgi:type II restriction enzyme